MWNDLAIGFYPITPAHYLVVAALMFVFGVAGVLGRRNAVGMLISIEVILNSVNLNFVVFNHYFDPTIDGAVMALFVIVLAACEAAIALAIVINLFNRFGTIQVDRAETLKG
jgi:NADH:ubiquinone oxidoreductase subunit K